MPNVEVEIDLDAKIAALEERRQELREYKSALTDFAKQQELTTEETRLNRELVVLRQVREARNASRVTVTEPSDAAAQRLRQALTDLDGVIRKEQAFDNVKSTVQTLVEAASTVSNAARA